MNIPITAVVQKITSFETEVVVQVDASLPIRMVALLAAAITAVGRPDDDTSTVTVRARQFESYLGGRH